MPRFIQDHFVPAIFDNAAWESKISISSYTVSPHGAVSIVNCDEDVIRTLRATNKANLKPFVSWKLLPSGRVLFSQLPDGQEGKAIRYNTEYPSDRTIHSSINLEAMKMIHAHRGAVNNGVGKMAAAGKDD